ncbi:hypothetical protein [Ereboglobus luteus]|uniref:Uncharacterized protein n=1 Tax=Ereboglobus luteus TaxID=1796921 RepID=A0A2U8DZH4_9BACT|nr:hypothetical protein [Ereboglobus luteus]AWI07864.1 hypothetical protein CKA38_00070 [Ereboglobus luteus]
MRHLPLLVVTILFACQSLCAAAVATGLVTLERHDKTIILSNGLVRAEIDRATGNLAQFSLGERAVLASPSYLDWHTGKNNHLARPALTIAADPAKNAGQKAELVLPKTAAAKSTSRSTM